MQLSRTFRPRQRRQLTRAPRNSRQRTLNPRNYPSSENNGDASVPPTFPPTPPSPPTVLRRDERNPSPTVSRREERNNRKRPPKKFREAVQEVCRGPLKRLKSEDPEDPDHQGTSTTAPPTSTSIPPTSSSHSKSDTQTETKNDEVKESSKRLAKLNRLGLLSIASLINSLNKELEKHSLFSEDFVIFGNEVSPTAHNCVLKTAGQLQTLDWLLQTGAMVEVSPKTPSYLEFFVIEKKNKDDQWRPLVNGREMRDRGIQNPSIRFTASATQALRMLSKDSFRWTSDLTNGFQLIRCRTSVYMTTRINGRVFLLLSPAQGFPQSPSACNAIFEREALRGGATTTYADNFGGTAPTLQEAHSQKEKCIKYMRSRGFTINLDETTEPLPQLQFLGVLVSENLLCLPPDKRDRLTKILLSKDKQKIDGYYAYLRDLFGNRDCVRKSITPTEIYFDGAKGGLSAAVCFCVQCEKPLEVLTRSALQKDQVTSEVNASILAGVLARKYGCASIIGDALYLKDAQSKSSTRPTIAEIISKKLPPIKFVKSELNRADPFSRGSTPQQLCSC